MILRAGPKSVHPLWLRDISEERRNWDLLVSTYSEDASWLPEPWEYLAQQPGPKWPPILDLYRSGALPDFKYVWVPDDDIVTTWANVNTLFNLMENFELQMAQPALTENSYVAWSTTRVDRQSLLRFSAFVEMMAPAFSREAFERCIPAAELVRSSQAGWGLDFVWPKILGYPKNKIAILDAAPVHHSRPIGSNYDKGVAYDEMQRIFREQEVNIRTEIFGVIPADLIRRP